jgi:Ankyrin repeats (3 copies)
MRASIESLFHAAEAGDLPRVQAILDEGRHDVNGSNYWQTDIDPRGWQRSPLHMAIVFGHLSLARWLLEHGADPNPRTRYGDTPLNVMLDPPLPAHWREAVELLMQHGADPAIANDDGESPLDRARRLPAIWAAVGGRLSRG